MKKSKLFVLSASFVFAAFAPLAQASCPQLAGTYVIDAPHLTHSANDNTAIITQAGCESITITWFTGSTQGAVYSGVVDGLIHKAVDEDGGKTSTIWSWNGDGIKFKRFSQLKPSEPLDELDFLLTADAQGNLDAVATVKTEGGSPMASASVYYKLKTQNE